MGEGGGVGIAGYYLLYLSAHHQTKKTQLVQSGHVTPHTPVDQRKNHGHSFSVRTTMGNLLRNM